MKLDEIARLAGVSRTTASYVINGKAKQYRVSDKTIAKVLAVVKQHHYQPNAMAASLRAGRTQSVGLVIPDLENSSYARIANYLEIASRQQGLQLLIACSEDDPEVEIDCIRHLCQRQVDGLIVSSAFTQNNAFYANWNHQKLPLIALDRMIDTSHFQNVIGADEADAYALAQALQQHSQRKIVYLGALPDLPVSQLREVGFRRSMQSQLDKITFLYAKNFTRQDGTDCFGHYLDHNPLPNPLPQALFVTSFVLLQGVIDAIMQRFQHLPNNLVIATFGDNELLDFLPCSVISSGQQHQLVAKTLLQLVSSYLQQGSYQPGIIQIKRQLVYRGSLTAR